MSENSNVFLIDEGTTIELLSDVSDKWDRYYAIRDKGTGIHLAFIGIGARKNSTGYAIGRDFYEVTGQGLILRSVEFYTALARSAQIDIVSFTRVDICLDLVNIDVSYFYKRLITEDQRIQSGKIFYRDKKEETIYF